MALPCSCQGTSTFYWVLKAQRRNGYFSISFQTYSSLVLLLSLCKDLEMVVVCGCSMRTIYVHSTHTLFLFACLCVVLEGFKHSRHGQALPVSYILSPGIISCEEFCGMELCLRSVSEDLQLCYQMLECFH